MEEQLSSYFSYDPLTGIVTWKCKNGKMRPGDIAGYKSLKDGYIRIGFKGKKYLAHRLAWFLYYDIWPTLLIDHIDGNRSNNCISNLRDVSGSENNFNRLGEHGVGQYRNGKWRAYLTYDSTHYHIGYFSSKEEATKAHNTFKEAFTKDLFDKNKRSETEFHGRVKKK